MIRPASLKTPGKAASMPTIELELPEYVVARKRGRGVAERTEFRFQLPKKMRPTGWKATHRLPIDKGKRTGRGDRAELIAVIADAEGLLKRMRADLARDRGLPIDEEERKAQTTIGTAPWLIAMFKQPWSEDRPWCKWNKLGEASQRNYNYAFREIKAWSAACSPAHPQLVHVQPATLARFVARFQDKPFKQRQIRVALNALMDTARFEGLLKKEHTSPAKGLPSASLPKSAPIEWTGDVLQSVCDLAIARGRPSVALFLRIKWWIGSRSTDVRKMREPEHYRDGRFIFDSGKRGKPIDVEATPDVVELVDATRPRDADGELLAFVNRFLCVNEWTSKPWNERVLSRFVSKLLEDVGRPDLKPSWLRHTVMTELDEAQAGDGASAALVGHSPATHARMKDRHYRIRTRTLAAQARQKLIDHRKNKQG